MTEGSAYRWACEAAVQMVPEQIEDISLSEFEDIAIPCDVGQMKVSAKTGLPDCKDDPADWIGWRACGCGIKYRLVCTHCRDAYLAWTAAHAEIVCANCGSETGGFHDFTPLKGTA